MHGDFRRLGQSANQGPVSKNCSHCQPAGAFWDKEKNHQMNAYDKVRLDQPNEMFAYMVTKNI